MGAVYWHGVDLREVRLATFQTLANVAFTLSAMTQNGMKVEFDTGVTGNVLIRDQGTRFLFILPANWGSRSMFFSATLSEALRAVAEKCDTDCPSGWIAFHSWLARRSASINRMFSDATSMSCATITVTNIPAFEETTDTAAKLFRWIASSIEAGTGTMPSMLSFYQAGRNAYVVPLSIVYDDADNPSTMTFELRS